MRYLFIALTILAGIAIGLGVYFTETKPKTVTLEGAMTIPADSVIYVEGTMTFRMDSIVNKRAYLTNTETSEEVIIEEQDILLVTHTVWGKPEEEK